MDYLKRLSAHSRNYYFFFLVFGYIIVAEIALYKDGGVFSLGIQHVAFDQSMQD